MKRFCVRLLCLLIPVAKWRRGLRAYLLKPRNVFPLDEHEFREYVANKTIAVVGNGPQQVGKHTGAEIDLADIVVRFNTFELDGFTDDYGTRTDVWVNGCGGTYDDERYIKIAQNVSWIIWRIPLEIKKEIQIFFLNVIKYLNKKIYQFPDDKLRECLSNPIFEKCNPSIGGLFLWYLKNYTKPKDIRIYGFSFLDDNTSEQEMKAMPHFYHKRENVGKHNMNQEVVFLRQLFATELNKRKK